MEFIQFPIRQLIFWSFSPVVIGAAKRDSEHPYGHGRIQAIATAWLSNSATLVRKLVEETLLNGVRVLYQN